MKCCAGIVTYNPDLLRLKQNIQAIYLQVEKLFIVDNGSTNFEAIEALVTGKNIVLIRNDINKGIACALNQLMSCAETEDVQWCLLLDQDSIAPENLINELVTLTNKERVAIVCPGIFDKNYSKQSYNYQTIEQIGICITSGSLTNVHTWRELGGFEERLFIDSVDSEYCIRLFFEGYTIYRNNAVVLEHELGKTEKHLIKQTTNHSPMRRYYIARNSLYVARKYKKIAYSNNLRNDEFEKVCNYLDKLISPKRCYLRQMQFLLLVLLYEKEKYKKIKAIIKGLKDGEIMYKTSSR